VASLIGSNQESSELIAAYPFYFKKTDIFFAAETLSV
jgi:hypothetical protein